MKQSLLERVSSFGFLLRTEKAKRADFKGRKTLLALDIGTEAVKALIFSRPLFEKGKTIILGTGLKYFDGRGAFSGKRFKEEKIKKTVVEAIEEAKKNLSFSLAEKELKRKALKERWSVSLGLPPDILKARVVRQSFRREKKEEKILEKEKKDIYKQMIEKVKDRVSREFAEKFGILPNDIHWISFRVLEVKIDGYLIENIRGYQGEELEFKILITFLPEYYWKTVRNVLSSLKFKIDKIVHLAENLSCVYGENKINGTFLDIGGDITQILEVRNGKLERISEFNRGGKAFTRTLSETLGIDKDRARSMIARYSAKTLSASTSEKMREIFSWEKRDWYDSFKEKLKEMGSQGVLPSKIYLFGGGSSFPEIEKVLKEEATAEWRNLPLAEAPVIKFINPDNIKEIEDTTKVLNKSQSVPSLLICCYNHDKKIL